MTDMAPRPLILGSTSAYRRELLERLRIPFTVESPHVDETPLPGEAPAALAVRLALAKARAVAERFPDSVVIGSDQVADLDGCPLGKPGNHTRAVEQLQRMRGKTVIFQTAVAVVCAQSGFAQEALAPVKVKFRDLTDAEIEPICAQKNPMTAPAAPRAKAWALPCSRASKTTTPQPWSACH